MVSVSVYVCNIFIKMSRNNPYSKWDRPGTPPRYIPPRVRRLANELLRSRSRNLGRGHMETFHRYVATVRRIVNRYYTFPPGQQFPWHASRRLTNALCVGISFYAICYEFANNLGGDFFSDYAGFSDDEEEQEGFFDGVDWD